jgi:hypothetical protein
MSDIILSWVLPDPNRERSVDPLGTGAFAERLADQLVPGFSGATTRARYLSLLCAAVRKAASSNAPLWMIHRIEAEHAVREAIHHRDEPPQECPDIVGRQRATAELKRLEWERPSRPERLYKLTAFAQYRSLMRALGLLHRGGPPRLTSSGEQLAAAYPLHGSTERRCLSRITKPEQGQLYGPLGLDRRASHADGSAQARRRATHQYLERASTPEARSLLQAHARLSARSGRVGMLLHTAYAWETLSIGLLCGLSLLVQRRRLSVATKDLKEALSRRPPVPDLSDDLDPASAAEHSVALLREALRVHVALPASCKVHVELARALVTARDPAEFLRRVVDQHRLSKGGDAWFQLVGDRVETLAPGKNLDFRLGARSYRLDAYVRFLRDVGKL